MRLSKKGMIFLAFFASILLLVNTTSAEILVGQPSTLYNTGDKFDLTLTINPRTPTSGFVTASLVCEDSQIELYKSPLSVEGQSSKEVTISTNLDSFLVQDSGGECYIQASFGSESASSQKFKITSEIIATLNVIGIQFAPDETVSVSGTAEKLNGDKLDGFVEVSVPDIGFNFKGQTVDGIFNITFRVPSDAPAGSYQINAHVYEKDPQGSVINEGETSSTIRIKQVVQEVGIAVTDQSLPPTKDLSYNIILYDQSKQHGQGDIAVNIYKPEGSLFTQEIVKADESHQIKLTPNSPPGYWIIEAKFGELKTTKQILIEEYRDLTFTLVNRTLIIENSGNVPYSGPVEIAIGEQKEVKDIVNLPVGESLTYYLKAPNGEYTISVGEGTNQQPIGTTFLTGRAVSISNSPGSSTALLTSLWVLLSLILLLAIALAVAYVYKMIVRKKMYGSSNTPKKMDSVPKSNMPVQKTQADNPNMIDKGERQESSVIALKIRNISQLENNPNAMQTIDSALWKAKEASAKIYADNDFRVMILAPALTKQKENETSAINVARSIERILTAYNRRSAQRIDYGLGVSFGTLIVESSQNKFKFMSLNNIVANTKRIAENSTSETLISESLQKKLVGKIKTSKLPDKNLYRIEKVAERNYAESIASSRSMMASKSAENKRRFSSGSSTLPSRPSLNSSAQSQNKPRTSFGQDAKASLEKNKSSVKGFETY